MTRPADRGAPASRRHRGARGLAAVLVIGCTLALPARPSAAQVTADSVRAQLGRVAYRDAEASARALLARLESAGRADTATARALDLLAEALWRGGRVEADGAIAYSDRAIALKERLYGQRHPETARSLDLRASLAHFIADQAGYRRFGEAALAIRLETLGPEDPETAASFATLAGADFDDERYPEAVAGYERALAVFEKGLGPRSRLVGQMLHNLGIVHRRMGDYVTAKSEYERALQIREAVLGEYHPDVAWTLNNLANVLYELGDFATVARYHRRALAIRERALGVDHPDVAISLVTLANVMLMLGDSTEAAPFYRRALAIQEKALGPDHPEVARTLNNLGWLVATRDDLPTARSMLERSARIRERVYGPEHSEVARTLTRLAYVHEQAGDDSLALSTLQRIIELRRQALGESHPLTGQALANAATAFARMGQDSLALLCARRSDEAVIEHFRLTVRSLEDRAAAQLGDARWSSKEIPISLAVRDSAADVHVDSLACDAVIRSRALVLDELADRQRAIVESGDPGLEALAREVISAREQLAERVVRGASASDTSARRALVDARERRDRAERGLAVRSARFRERQRTTTIGLSDVRAALPPRTALVAYSRYEYVEPWPRRANGTRVVRPEVPRYVAFVIRPDRDVPAVLDLGSASVLDDRAARWLRLAGKRPAAVVPARRERESRDAGAALRALVWDPVAARLSGIDRVFVVPDGALHGIPFAAFPVSAGRYLVEQPMRLHLLSAERDLVTLTPPPVRGSGLLILGAPDFERTDASTPRRSKGLVPATNPPLPDEPARERRGPVSECPDFASLRFDPLPGSAVEVAEVSRRWSRATAGDSIVSRTGADASEGNFKRLAAGRQVLHLATHGFFMPQRCRSTVGARAGTDAVDPRAETLHESPLLRSGLALAGANRRATRTGEDDGIVTAEEIAGLDLRGLEWAVLSACQTGSGDVQTNEGVLGLRRAFQIAGVRTVFTSLWSVDDEATREWMAALYRARARGLDTVEAAAAADLECLRALRARGRSTLPYYWAPFVASGDWR